MNAVGRQPNLLVIMTDQQRADALGCAEVLGVETPNLDRLAAGGTRWPNAVCDSPECVPARAAVLTGRPAHHTGVADNATPLAEGAWTFPRALRDAGFRTWAVGKQHFRPHRADHGFDHLVIGEPRTRTDDDYLDHLDSVGLGWIDEPWGRRSDHYYLPQVSVVPDAHHHTTWTADQAIRLIEHRGTGPFLGFVGFLHPHPPFDPSVEFSHRYQPDDVPDAVDPSGELAPFPIEVAQNHMKWRDQTSVELAGSLRAAYLACVTQLDVQVGRILDALDAAAPDTIVVFLSDHGELLGDHGLWGKRSFLRGSIGIPLIVRRPAEPDPGRVDGTLASQRDLAPTLLRLVGLAAPPELPGLDLYLDDGRADGLVACYGTGDLGVVAYLTTRYRWSYSIAEGRQRLFDLTLDPGETDDLTARDTDHPLAVAARRDVEAELRASGDPLGYLDTRGRLRVADAAAITNRFSRNRQRGRRT